MQDYISALQPKGVKLAVLNLYDQQQEAMMGRINDLWAAAADHVETLSKEHAQDLSRVVAKLLTSYMDKELQLAVAATAASAADAGGARATANGNGSSSGASSTVHPQPGVAWEDDSRKTRHAPSVGQQAFLLPVLCQGLAGLGTLSYEMASNEGGILPGSAMFNYSLPGLPIPFMEAALALQDAAASSCSFDNSSSTVDDAKAQLSAYCSSIVQATQHSVALQQVTQLWEQAMARPAMQGQVEQMVQVLEAAVLPHNKHTRRRAEESGPSLYLPALIKAASSNYTNRKIFASKTAGGKRTYQVALLLDVSQSMQGHLQQCGLEVLAVMTDALGRVGLDDFVVMTFGAVPVLVKDADTAWDGPCKLALMEQMNCKTGEEQ